MCKSSLGQSENADIDDRTRNFAIKLFGKTIPVQFSDKVGNGSAGDRGSSSTVDEFVQSEIASRKRPPPTGLQRDLMAKCSKVENIADKKERSLPLERSNGDQNGEKLEKSQAKPDKVVACPRCQSLDTKFCYFNNYNVNQPRHFCKNCRRYWTDGGTMRNIPVGAGRRKSKSFSAFNQQLQVRKTKDENGIIAGDSIKNETEIAVESTCVSSVITAVLASEISKNARLEEIDGDDSIAFADGLSELRFGSTSLDSQNPVIPTTSTNVITAESFMCVPKTVIENSSEATRNISIRLGLCKSPAFPACVRKDDVK